MKIYGIISSTTTKQKEVQFVMVRIVVGFFLVIGSAGGMELTSLSPMGALLFASIGFGIFLWSFFDGTIDRLANQAKLEQIREQRGNRWLYR